MKQSFKVLKNTVGNLEWLYVPDVLYAEYENCKRCLQLIIPYKREWKEPEKYPLVLFIPGSAWYRQEMYNSLPAASALAKKGFVVAMLQYRESKLAHFPAQVEDVWNAVRLLESKAEEFHIDMDNIFLAGSSSGSHIALMAGFTAADDALKVGASQELSDKIRGIIDLCGPTDLLLFEAEPVSEDFRPKEDLLGVKSVYDDLESARRASCKKYLSKEKRLPAVLMFHGQQDSIVSVRHSRELFEALKDCDKEVEYYEIEGADHMGIEILQGELLDIVLDFIRKNEKWGKQKMLLSSI